jgi:hypothetical protein
MSRSCPVAVGSCIALALFIPGCGKEPPPAIVPVQGAVLLNGAPLPNALVRFVPIIGYGSEYIASGITDDQGRFTLQCNGEQGACATETMVLVTEAPIPRKLQGENAQRELGVYFQSLKNRPIPKNYGTPVSTPLKTTVSQGQPHMKLELKR